MFREQAHSQMKRPDSHNRRSVSPRRPPRIVQPQDDILNLLREKGVEAARRAQRGLIVQPGAIGDCILTLPLAALMKESLALGSIDMLGHTQHIEILPGRSCIDSIRSIDTVDVHRLFVDPEKFELADHDPLISAFAEYSWIVTFLGEPHSHFEQNLIFTTNCSHSSEVLTLALKPPKDFTSHLMDFCRHQFATQTGLSCEHPPANRNSRLIETTTADIRRGKELLGDLGLKADKGLIVIHPGSGSTKKCWHIENFLAVAKQLRSHGFDIVFLLGPAETERFDARTVSTLQSVGQCVADLSLAEVLALFSCAHAFIGNDSGMTHLAGAIGLRTFAVFGPTSPTVYQPIGPLVTILKGDARRFAAGLSSRLQDKIVTALLS